MNPIIFNSESFAPTLVWIILLFDNLPKVKGTFDIFEENNDKAIDYLKNKDLSFYGCYVLDIKPNEIIKISKVKWVYN